MHKHNNIRYRDDTMLMADSETKLREILTKVNKQWDLEKKKPLNVRREIYSCQQKSCYLLFGDKKIKQVQKIASLGSVVTDKGKGDTRITRHEGIAEDAFRNFQY